LNPDRDITEINPRNILPDHRRPRIPNSRFRDYIISSVNTHQVDYPTYSQAMKSSDRLKWEEAIATQFKTLTELGTYQVVEYNDIPKNAELFPSKMHLRVKRDALSNEYLKHKARLVVLNNKSKSTIAETFSPTVSHKSIALISALAVALGLLMVGYDIYGAFLVPTINREVYISLPKQLSIKPVYWKLKKCLYGLPDSPRTFYDHVSKTIMNNAFVKTEADPCVFIKRLNKPEFIIATIFVDDFMVVSSNQYLIDILKQALEEEYTITEATLIEAYIGIHIKHNLDHSIILSQPGFLSQLLEDNHLSECVPVVTPMSIHFNDDDQDSSPLLNDIKKNCSDQFLEA